MYFLCVFKLNFLDWEITQSDYTIRFRAPKPWKGQASHPDTELPRAFDGKTAGKKNAGIQDCLGSLPADFQEMFSRPGAV